MRELSPTYYFWRCNMSSEVNKKLDNFKESLCMLSNECELITRNVINEDVYKNEFIESIIEIRNELLVIELKLKRLL